MSSHHVLILGAGAAGAEAARELVKHGDLSVTLVGSTGEFPYNRTLVNKGVALGLLTPELAALPVPGGQPIADSARTVDLDARIVRTASGTNLPFESLIVATGSAPRPLDPAIPGVPAALTAGRLTTLHSLADAVRVRDRLAGGSARVVVLGGGLVAAETASLLHGAGHRVTMVTRSAVPGADAFGAVVAERLADAHRATVTTHFGHTLEALDVDGDSTVATLDDGTRLPADLVVVAHGTVPAGPAPWSDGAAVDDRLRVDGTAAVYAAGGVATHHDGPGSWRIDHWSDAAAQGQHAARTVLFDLGLAADPGPYAPRSPYAAVVHGRVLAAAGRTGPGPDARMVSGDPLVVVHEQDGAPVGVTTLDAGPAIAQWLPRLHAAPAPV